MKKLLIIAFICILLLSGCNGGSVSDAESESIQYLLEMLKNTDVPEDMLDLVPDVEDAIMMYVKNTLFNSAYEELISDDGYVPYEKASSFVTNISGLSAICSGKTSLYRGDKLLYEYESNSKENAYLLLGNKLALHISDEKYIGGRLNEMCLRGSVLVAEFSIDPSNYAKLIADKDVYKYLDLKVSIIDKQEIAK